MSGNGRRGTFFIKVGLTQDKIIDDRIKRVATSLNKLTLIKRYPCKPSSQFHLEY